MKIEQHFNTLRAILFKLVAKLGRAQPLIPQAIGFIAGEAVAAWANGNRLEVRTEQNKILLSCRTQGLESNMDFVANRYLVVPFGTYIMVHGFKVYDFRLNAWSFEFNGPAVDVGFCGTHPAEPIIANVEEKGLALWDLSKLCRLSLIKTEEPINTVALGGPDDAIAIGDYERISIFHRDQDVLFTHVPGGDVTALAWDTEKISLICGNVAGDIVQRDAKTLTVMCLLHSANKEISRIRISPHGKFVAATTYDKRAILIDLNNGQVTFLPDIMDIAFSPVNKDHLFVVSAIGIKRIAISSLIS